MPKQGDELRVDLRADPCRELHHLHHHFNRRHPARELLQANLPPPPVLPLASAYPLRVPPAYFVVLCEKHVSAAATELYSKYSQINPIH